MPKGIQLKRTRGWHKPSDALRRLPPIALSVIRSASALPGVPDQAAAVRLFEQWLLNSEDLRAQWMRGNLHQLRGHDLACWCELGEPCHANVLMRLANAGSLSKNC